MPPKTSAGLLMYRQKNNELEFFIVHPGGPYWKNKDEQSWSIPKGEIEFSEQVLETAKREFKEETGIIPKEPFIPLGTAQLKSGKIIHAWAFEHDWSGLLMCQSFVEIEWPPHSKRMIKVPEVDRAGFFKEQEAKTKLNPAQNVFIDRLKSYLLQNNNA